MGAGALVAVALFLVLRPGDGGEGEGRTSQATTTRQTTTGMRPSTTAATTTTPRPTGPRVIRVAVRGGRVRGGLRQVTLEKGKRVVLVVSADVSDHVHLHGYNRFADVAPGRAARLSFRATIVGRFEVELEDRGLPILELEVRP